MKKILCVVLCILFVFSTFTVTSFAADTYGTIIGENVTASAGDTVTVKFTYENNPGFWIIFMTLFFDDDSLELVKVDNGAYNNASLNLMTYPDNDGKVLLDIEGKEAKDVTGDGVLAEVTFRVKDNAKSQNNAIVISIGDGKACNFDTKLIKPAVRYATVNVVCKEHAYADGVCTKCNQREDGAAGEQAPTPEVIKPNITSGEDKEEVDQTVANTQTAGENVLSNGSAESDSSKQASVELDTENSETTAADDDLQLSNLNIYVLVAACVVLLITVLTIVLIIVKKKKV